MPRTNLLVALLLIGPLVACADRSRTLRTGGGGTSPQSLRVYDDVVDAQLSGTISVEDFLTMRPYAASDVEVWHRELGVVASTKTDTQGFFSLQIAVPEDRLDDMHLRCGDASYPVGAFRDRAKVLAVRVQKVGEAIRFSQVQDASGPNRDRTCPNPTPEGCGGEPASDLFVPDSYKKSTGPGQR